MKTVLLRNKRVLSVAFIIYVIGIIMGTFFSNILPVERQNQMLAVLYLIILYITYLRMFS